MKSIENILHSVFIFITHSTLIFWEFGMYNNKKYTTIWPQVGHIGSPL